MRGKLKEKLLSILPIALAAVIVVLAAVNIGLIAGSGKSYPPPVAPPSPPPPAACAHENATPEVTLAPTCTDEGVKTYACDYCHTVVRTEAIAPLGHDYARAETSGLCETCGEKICSRGLTYELSSNGEYYIVSKKNAVPPQYAADLIDLVIPEYHNGKPVKEILDDAFVSQEYIKSVSIPSTIEYIGVGAFSMTKIRKLYFNAASCRDFVGKNWVFYRDSDSTAFDVTFGKAVRRIPDRLFYPNNSVPDRIPKITGVSFEQGCKVESIGEYAFYKTGVTELDLPLSLKTIGDHAFDASALISVRFGASMTDIGAHAFDSCDKLEKVDLSKTSILNLSSNAFKNCTSMTELKLPASLIEIGSKAFFGCAALETAELGAETIGDDAFSGCAALKTVTLPSTLKRVGSRVFEGCVALGEINYDCVEMEDLPSGNRAFFGAGRADGVTVTIGEGVKYIPSRLFYSTADAANNLHIKELNLSSTVTEIADYAFRGTSIDKTRYSGTAAQFAAVSIGTGNAEIGTPEYSQGA